MNTNINLPSPAALAKKEKETLKNISLRIKQDTYDIFDVIAKKEETSANALMINLLDYYAQNYREAQQEIGDDNELVVDMMQSFLDKALTNALKMDEDGILLKFSGTKKFHEMLNGYSDLSSYADLLEALRGESSKYILVCFGNYDVYAIDLYFTKDEAMVGYDEGERLPGDTVFDSVTIAADKWPITALLLSLYDERASELRPDLANYYTEKMSKSICEVAKKTKNIEDYARKLVEILMEFWRGQNN